MKRTPGAVGLAIIGTGLLMCSWPARATMPPISGIAPAPLTQAFRDGLFALPAPAARIGIESAQSVWRVPVILVGFSDAALRHTAPEFDLALFDTTHSTATGSVFDYYQWVSGRRLEVTGRVVAAVQLGAPTSYYARNSYGLSTTATPNNSYGMTYDALMQVESGVDWSEYDADHDGYVDMLWVVHSGVGGETTLDRNTFWSITSRMSSGWRNGNTFTTSDPIPGSPTARMRIDRFTILPELSALVPGTIAEIGTFCHEFGHALGLPDLYDTSDPMNSGPGNWSLMSSGAYGGDGISPRHPSHMGAWPLQFLGWDQTLRPASDTTLVLDPVGRQGSVVEWWFQGESNSEHFLIENRRREGFDLALPSEGLVLTHVDEAVIGPRLRSNNVNAGPSPGLVLLEGDGDYDLIAGRNRGDPNDPFPGALGRTLIDDGTTPSARTFSGAVNNMALRQIMSSGDGMRFTAQVRARGWLPATDRTGSAFQPLDSYGAGRVSGTDDRGEGYTVGLETRSGRSQVILRRSGTAWSDPFQVSNSTGAATEPALAVLPGGDLGIVWSDTREGRSKLYARFRIGGSWTPERVLVSLPGDCLSPAIGADARGTMALAFRYVEADIPRVELMRFSYFWPFGQPRPLTDIQKRPGSPVVAVGPAGETYVLWVDWTAAPQRIWFSRYLPDSGVSQPALLTPQPFNPQLLVSAVVAPNGTLHAVWAMTGPGSGQLRYQRRPVSGAPSPADTMIELQGGPIQNPVVALDADGGLHVAFEAPRSGQVGQTQVRYKRWQAVLGWDYRSTELTTLEVDGSASRPQVFPSRGGDVEVLYTGYPDGQAHLMARARHLAAPAPISTAPTALFGVPLGMGPNPLRAGDRLELAWSDPGPRGAPVVDFFDLAGRRIAAVPLRNSGDMWVGQLDTGYTRTLRAGVYLARPRGSKTPASRLVVIR